MPTNGQLKCLCLDRSALDIARGLRNAKLTRNSTGNQPWLHDLRLGSPYTQYIPSTCELRSGEERACSEQTKKGCMGQIGSWMLLENRSCMDTIDSTWADNRPLQ